MNIFRLLGDFAHLISVFILIRKISSETSVKGISFKSQLLYFLIFITRYLDLVLVWRWPKHIYNTVFKFFFIGSSGYTLFLMLERYKPTLDRDNDNENVWRLIAGAAVLAILLPYEHTFIEISWAFSIWLEAVAILPQFTILAKTEDVDIITFQYLYAIGAYRGLYVLNWIYRFLFEGHFDSVACPAGVIQTGLFIYFYYKYTSIKSNPKLPLSSVSKSDTAANSSLFNQTVFQAGQTHHTQRPLSGYEYSEPTRRQAVPAGASTGTGVASGEFATGATVRSQSVGGAGAGAVGESIHPM